MSSLPTPLLVTLDDGYSQEWILDSSASIHVTPYREWFSTYDSGKNGCVHLGNNYAYDLSRYGNVKLAFPDGSMFMLYDVRHVS